MKVLVTGAAGYVGSTVVSALRDAGDEPIGLDDLSRGRRDFLAGGPSYVGDIADRALLDTVFADHPDIGVAIHCAARTVVSDSVADPVTYYRENVVKALELFDALVAHGCHRVVFSSSAAIYGASNTGAVDEAAPVAPVSPYGNTKAVVERMLGDLCAATPLRALSLRYFNPIGCDPKLRTGPYDPAPTHALGRLLTAAERGTSFVINGGDWPTPDGTPLRDFVHVWDVALAHVAAAHRWVPSAPAGRHEIVNIGIGRATSVRELVDAFNGQAPRPVPVEYGPRRAGDTVGCYAAIGKAAAVLQWQPRHTVGEAIGDVLRWTRSRAALQPAP